MSRYIDADKIEYTARYVGMDEFAGFQTIAYKSEIDAIPTADVVEVKHGEWRKTGVYGVDFEMMKCSNCRKRTEGGYGYHYCPQCGAKMDGERRTE